ncbi:hypothetical protein IKG48_00655 [Candidatus Saccharibacteria bacterium]|nr:hypothetical protein [Candidatus Saccharibacteria bacterium]
MKKTHKKLLGIGGLALVAGVTAIAYHIPDAGAIGTSANGRVDVSVNVIGQNPEVHLISPLDGAKLTNPNLHIVARYVDADQVEYLLSDGVDTITVPSPALSGNATGEVGNSGEHDFYYNLKNFNTSRAGYGSYTLKAKVTRKGSSVEDTVRFSYTPASVDDGTIPTDENNNPIVDLKVKASVVKVEAIVLKPDGEEALRTTVDTNGQTQVSMVLPFSENQSLESDTYTVKFITYSYNGLGVLVPDQSEDTTNLRTQVTYEKKVEPEPEVPSDDTPPTPQDPSAGDENNPETPAPSETNPGDTVHIIVTDPETGEKVLETDVPVNDDGSVTVPLGDYNLPKGEYDIDVIPYKTDPVTGEKVLDEDKKTTSEVNYEGKTEENQPSTNEETGDAVIPITNDGSVEKAKIIIEDKDGNKTTIIVDVKEGQDDIEIPFEELGLTEGDYKVTIITYSVDPETGKLAPNQNPAYVRPIDINYTKPEPEPEPKPSYNFIDKDNGYNTHTWNRNADAGESLRLRIPNADVYDYFDSSKVYFTYAANLANLFDDANRLNSIYFEESKGGLNIDLLSSFLATLPNGEYYLGVALTNGDKPTVKIKITGNTNTDNNNPNPVIDVNVEEGVEKVEIIVYDKNGKEIFRFEAPVTDITTNHITLPFNNYGLSDGDYLVAVIPYARNDKGELVPLISEEEAKKNATKIGYGTPEVPNTGNFLASLNLSSKDFLISGLVVFAVVTAGGIFILRRKETRR